MQLLPGSSRATLTQGYFDAFRNLSRGLAALTAFVILVLLGKAVPAPLPANASGSPGE